jgi:acetoin utilization protein AcuC
MARIRLADDQPGRTGADDRRRSGDYEVGHDPADPVDRAIMTTRKAVFPPHGLMP